MRRLFPRFELGLGNPEERVQANECQAEQGFMLLGLIVAIFFILLVLSIAAPKVALELRREREVEAVHRGNQYVRAIQLYYRKTNTYPGSMDALAKGTPVKYLRQQYVDPLTGKADWRLIHVGEAKTTVKGFFGQPLAGLAPGLGAAAGQASPGGTGTSPGATGSNSAFGGSNSAFGSSASGSSSAFGSSSPGTGGFGSNSPTGATTGTAATPTGATTGTDTSGTNSSGAGSNGIAGTSTPGSPIGGQSAGSFSGSGAPFVGVGIPKEGTSIVVLNEQTSYNTWEFIYDPRIEQLKAKAGLLGGGTPGIGGSSIGTPIGGAGNSGFGSQGNSSFGSPGSSGSSSFGSSSGSSFGSSPSSGGTQGTGTSSPTTPQQPQ